ncbi:MAG: phosphatase PAP2 family protein [Rhodospirillaceae bacterium]
MTPAQPSDQGPFATLFGLWQTRPGLCLLALVLVVCPPLMLWVDMPVAEHFRHHLHVHWEGFFKVVTDIGKADHWYLLGIIAAVFWRFRAAMALHVEDHHAFMRRFRGWLYFLAVLISSGIAVTLLKALFGRWRPRMWFDQELYGFAPLSFQSSANSFPSGHSQVSMAVAVALVVLFPRHWPFWLAGGVLITVSRVATTVHYVSDVIAGAALGIAAALIVQRWFEKRYGPLRP